MLSSVWRVCCCGPGAGRRYRSIAAPRPALSSNCERVTLSAEVAPTRLISVGTAVPIAHIGTHGSFVTSYSSRPNAKFTPTDRHDKTVLSVSCQAVWTESARRSESECVRRSHRQCLRRPTHSDAERTCRAVGPTQFTPPHQTRQDGPVCVLSAVAVWISFESALPFSDTSIRSCYANFYRTLVEHERWRSFEKGRDHIFMKTRPAFCMTHWLKKSQEWKRAGTELNAIGLQGGAENDGHEIARHAIRYDTIRDAILTCARKPTWVSLIYCTETTTKKCKTEKLKRKNGYAQK